MKTAILKTIADLPFEVLTYAMMNERCKTLNELAAKLAKNYIKEDLPHINAHLTHAYKCSLSYN